MRRRKEVAFSINDEQLDALDALSKETKVPRAALIRAALDNYIAWIERHRRVGHDVSEWAVRRE